MSDALWTLADVHFRHRGADRDAVDGLSLTLHAGRVTAIVGPNGAGKSTLVQLLQGLALPRTGTVHFRGRAATAWDRLAFAREVGVLPQGEELVLPLRVREVVQMGRYPHLGAWRRAQAADTAAVAEALALTCTADLAMRPFAELSGGERQRVRVARALAQAAPVLLLDEPTAALDIRHEMQLFELVRHLGVQGRSIVLVTHALDLAARYADTLVLMADGRALAHGAPAEVLTEANLSAAFRWPVTVVPRPGAEHIPMILPLSQPEAVRRRSSEA